MSPFSHTLALLIISLSFSFISLQLGTDAMASKSKQKEIVKKRNDSKHRMSTKVSNARRTVTNRAITSDEECPMKF